LIKKQSWKSQRAVCLLIKLFEKVVEFQFFDNKKYERIKNLALNVNALLIFAELFLSSLPKNIYFLFC